MLVSPPTRTTSGPSSNPCGLAGAGPQPGALCCVREGGPVPFRAPGPSRAEECPPTQLLRSCREQRATLVPDAGVRVSGKRRDVDLLRGP